MGMRGIELADKKSYRLFKGTRFLKALLRSGRKTGLTRNRYNDTVRRGESLAYTARKVKKSGSVNKV